MQNNIVTLIFGVVSSLIAMALAAYFSRRFLERARGFLIHLVLRELDAGIDSVYPKHSAAERAIVEELRRAQDVRILSLRGRSVVEGYLRFLIREHPFLKIDLLLADPETPSGYNPLIHRALELQQTEPAMSPDSFIAEGRTTLRAIYELNLNHRLCIKTYNFPAVFRLIITESAMFVSYYPNSGRTREAPVYRIRSGTPMFAMFHKYFDRTWRDSRTREPTEYSSCSQIQGWPSQGAARP